MLFNSFEFLFFLPTVLLLYYLLPFRWQNLMLLVASYVFYGFWDPRFLTLIFISTVIDYYAGVLLGRSDEPAFRKKILVVSLVSNLGILCIFKYMGFFYDSASQALGALGLVLPPFVLKIALPVGISFYTFQTLSYTIDVYHRKLRPTQDFLNFALFVSFFPQLVAGPIERARNLLPQVENPRVITSHGIASGLWLILFGFFKKVAIGDAIAPYVDEVFNKPDLATSPMALGAIYLFAIQIYADFSGYSDIARGCARLMGFELMVNFRQPYLSKSIGEFWRRWHISLSTWFRDYVYIPLGGNRKGEARTYENLAITMLVTGLWHGARWTYVIWGVIHGAFMLAERVLGLKPLRVYEEGLISGSPGKKIMDVLRILAVFHIAAFAFAVFRAGTVSDGMAMAMRAFGDPYFGGDMTNLIRFAFFGGIIFLFDLGQEILKSDEPFPLFLPAPIAGIIAALLVLGIFVLGGQAQAFIYFQF